MRDLWCMRKIAGTATPFLAVVVLEIWLACSSTNANEFSGLKGFLNSVS